MIELVNKEEVKKYRKTYYNKTNTCDRCGKDLMSKPGHPHREYNKEEKWTGKWLCQSCYVCRNSRNIIRDYKMGNLDPNCSSGKGYIYEQITCKSRGIKNLNIENNNFNSKFDHSIDSEYGIIESKGSIYNCTYRYWHFDTERYQKFDNMIAYCMNKYMTNIERVYIFPWNEVTIRKSITIYKNPSTSRSHWYDEYIIDEKPYNDSFHNLNKSDLSALRNIKINNQ